MGENDSYIFILDVTTTNTNSKINKSTTKNKQKCCGLKFEVTKKLLPQFCQNRLCRD